MKRLLIASILPPTLAALLSVSVSSACTRSPSGGATPQVAPGENSVLTYTAASGPLLSWPVFGHDPARSGVDVGDTVLTKLNVSKLVAKWQISLGQVADSTPILLPAVRVGTVTRAMLFQTAKNGETFGIDAHTGQILWRFTTSGPNITDSTPAADPSGTAIYVPGVDGMVHKVNAATGKQIAAPGFPARITNIPATEKDASALNVANGYLYAATSGYFGDAPPYDGHVVSVNLTTGATHVFNSLCSNLKTLPTSTSCPNNRSGIWSRGGVVVDPDSLMNGRIYASTGNGLFNGNSGGHNYGDSVLALSEDASAFIGNYTPADYAQLQNSDEDVGSSSPVLLPRQASSTTPLMLVQGGKDLILRLLNRAKLLGVGHELQKLSLPSALFATPAVWSDSSNRTWIFMGFPLDIRAYRLQTNVSGVSTLVEVWDSQAGLTNGEGTSPVVSNGIVFVAMDNALLALDTLTGKTLWSSANGSALHTIGPVHWESPIVVNGWVYCSDENGKLTAYALP